MGTTLVLGVLSGVIWATLFFVLAYIPLAYHPDNNELGAAPSSLRSQDQFNTGWTPRWKA